MSALTRYRGNGKRSYDLLVDDNGGLVFYPYQLTPRTKLFSKPLFILSWQSVQEACQRYYIREVGNLTHIVKSDIRENEVMREIDAGTDFRKHYDVEFRHTVVRKVQSSFGNDLIGGITFDTFDKAHRAVLAIGGWSYAECATVGKLGAA